MASGSRPARRLPGRRPGSALTTASAGASASEPTVTSGDAISRLRSTEAMKRAESRTQKMARSKVRTGMGGAPKRS